MEFNKSVSNPMLAGSIELVKAEDTPEHRNMFVTELTKAVLLSPVIVDPAPEEDDQGNYSGLITSWLPAVRCSFPCCPRRTEKGFLWRLRIGGNTRHGRKRIRKCLISH